jgi:hypothetical protein
VRLLVETKTPLADNTIDNVVLGQRKMAEQLIEWAKKNAPWATFRKETTWGLRLDFYANNGNPICCMFMEEEKLNSFLNGLGPIGALGIDSFGFSLCGPFKHTGEAVNATEAIVAVATKSDPQQEALYMRDPNKKPETICMGSILFTEEGMLLRNQVEHMTWLAEQEEAANQVANQVKEKTTPTVEENVDEEIEAEVAKQFLKLSFNE